MDFAKFEKDIRNYWKVNNVQDSIAASRKMTGCPKWEFLDGPPFVNGSPHHGHLLVSTIKDTMARYMSQKGHQISYQIGFDCHGLPLEQEAEKRVGKVGPGDSIEKIRLFNDTCRDIIKNCSEVWYDVLGQLGRQFNRDETYYTCDFSYMKSLWGAFRDLWDKNLIYCSKKVMPYSAQCETPLSNFEANQNYKERTDTSVFVRFKVRNSACLDEGCGEYLLAWTTTPWSLFANQGICVSPTMEYSLVKSGSDYYWIASVAIERVFEQGDIKIVHTLPGSYLKNVEYEPLFGGEGKYRVYVDDYVDDASGTGIVHLAPLFGEDDMRVMRQNGYTMDMLPNIVDSQVRFTINHTVNNVDIYNRFVMDTSTDVVIELKRRGVCIKSQKIVHSYPHCWRTDHPLVYLATDAWFLKVQDIIPDILENNAKIHWYPGYVGTERFANWIRSAPDWCLSRNRTWGTPIPIWTSPRGKQVCIGTVEELEGLTGHTVADLHLDHIQNLTFEKDGETYSRTFGVLDCWFESGMAPFARQNATKESVDFIAESVDQTRGWFYTLNVLSTALYNQPAYKKVIVSGLILAEDGKKMSKRLGNYTNPVDLMNKYGSDILRLYLLSSTASKAESFCFKDKDLVDISRKLVPYANAFNILNESLKIFNGSIIEPTVSTNKLDNWIYNTFHSFRNKVYDHVDKLELTHVPNLIYKFIDQLCNTYIKLSRDRLKSQGTDLDAQESLSTLRYVLDQTNLLLVPFAPHLAEYFSKQLGEEESIHMRFIESTKVPVDESIVSSVESLNELFECVRALRIKMNRSVVYPLESLELYTSSTGIVEFEDVIKKELGVKHLSIRGYTELPFSYRPNRGALGRDFRAKSGEIVALIESGCVEYLGAKPEHWTVDYAPRPREGYLEAKFEYCAGQEAVVYLSKRALEKEAHVNHIRRQISLLRKQLNYKMSDRVGIVMERGEVFSLFDEELWENLNGQLGTKVVLVDKLEGLYNEISTLNDEYGTIKVFLHSMW